MPKSIAAHLLSLRGISPLPFLALAGLASAIPSPVLAEAAAEIDPGTIVVTATRSEQSLVNVPADVTVKDVEMMRRDGFTYGTEEFRGVPGVSFRRGEGDGDEFPFVSIRGSTGTEGYLTMIDGIPFIGNDEEGILNIVPYPALERVEVVKGPVSALYGRGALYGAVNYITRAPREDRIDLSFSAGSDDYYRGEASISRKLSDNAGLFASVFYEDYGGWREKGGRTLLNLFAKFDFDIGERTTATIYGNYFDRSSGMPNGLPLDTNGNVIAVAGGREAFLGYGDPHMDIKGGIGALRLEHRATDELTLTATAQARRFDRNGEMNFYDPYGFDSAQHLYGFNGLTTDERQTILYGEITANWRSGVHNLIVGISGERGKSAADKRWSGVNGFTFACGFNYYLIQVDWQTGRVANDDHPCFAVNDPQSDDHFTNTFWGAFIQDEIALSDRWHLTVGGRYDSFRRKVRFDPITGVTDGSTESASAHAFSPKASLSWRYDGGQVYVAYGRGFNSNFGSGFEWDSNKYARPEQKPTTLDSFELGWKGSALGDTLRFSTVAFWSAQKNRRQILPNPDAETDYSAPSNLISYGDRYEAKGVEVSLDIRPRDGTSILINYSHIAPKWKDYVLQTSSGSIDLSGTTPVGVAPNIVYIAAEQRITPWLTGRAVFEWYDDYKVTQDNRVENGGYELLTLNARIQPESWNGLTLDLTLMNALDKEYYWYFGGRSAPTYATPGTPRQFRATLRASF